MPVQIDEVNTEVHVLPEQAAAPGRASPPAAADPITVERLRPIVLQILKEELERLRRQHG